MPFDYFLKIDDVDGGSTAKGHEKWFEIESFSWGCSNASSGGNGGGTGKSQLQDLSITIASGKASPTLLAACATGRHFDKVTLELTKAGKDPYYKVAFSDCLVSSFESGGSSGDPIPTESVSLNFVKIEFTEGPPPPPDPA